MVKLSERNTIILFYGSIIVVTMSPVWMVDFFLNQDGAAHANNAWIMSRLTAGDPSTTQFARFNTIALPNSIGHWLLAGFLQFLTPFTATKLMVSGIFAGWVAAAGFLRYKTAGVDGVKTAMLIGAAVAFNWLWLVGFYNFCIGVVVVIFSVALFFGWKDNFTALRAGAISILFLVAYFSHLIAVAALAGCVALLAFDWLIKRNWRSIALLAAAAVPLLPLVVVFRSVSASSDMGFSPVWRSVDHVFSIGGWFHQIRSADPFLMISRRQLPFIDVGWEGFAVFSPIIWIVAAIALLVAATVKVRRYNEEGTRNPTVVPFVIVVFLMFAAALIGPDDFGSEHGGVLRPRLLLFGILCFIPVFRARSILLKRAAQVCLAVVIGFQTLVLWNYALESDRVGKEYALAEAQIPATGGVAMISVLHGPPRFYSSPVSMINNFSGIGRNRVVWDNYELGHYLFPVIANSFEDKEFIYAWTRNSAILTNFPPDRIAAQASSLQQLMAENNGRIETLMIWGADPAIDSAIRGHFGPEPFYRSMNIRLYRRSNATE